MRRYLRLFALYFVQYAKVRLAYKTDLVVSIITSAAATAFGIALVFLLFEKARTVAGWSFEEIVFLYGFGLIPLALFNTVSINLYFFGQTYIVEGKFDRVLLRPLHSLFQVMNEQFRLEALSDVVVGLVAIGWAVGRMDAPPPAAMWALGAVCAVCGMLIYLAVFLILTAVSFWVEDRVGVIPPVYNMLSFGRYPLDIYNPFIRFLLSWVVPFGFASFYPAAKMLGRAEHAQTFLALPIVTAAFLAAAFYLWNRGTANYSSTGS